MKARRLDSVLSCAAGLGEEGVIRQIT